MVGEIRESNALPGESPERKKVRFLLDSGDGGAAAVTVEEPVETTGQTSMARDRCSRDSVARWNQTWILSALDRLLENWSCARLSGC